MSGIFDWSGQEAKDLETQYKELHDELHKVMQEGLSEVETIRARTEAQQEWFNKTKQKIGDSYMGLVFALESGDIESINHTIFSMKDLTHAVFKMPVFDKEGNVTDFGTWGASLFSNKAKSTTIRLRADKARKESAFPEFDDIEKEYELEKQPYELPEKGFFNKVSGSYEEELKKLIDILGMKVSNAKANSEDSVRKARVLQEEQKRQLLSDFGKEMQVASAIVRVNASFDGTQKDMKEALERYLPFLMENFGQAKTIEWMTSPRGDAPSLAMTLIEKSNLSLNDQRHPMNAMLASMPDDFARAAMLNNMAAEVSSPRIEKDLRTRATEMTGEFVRLSETALIKPADTGFAQVQDNTLRLACHGSEVTIPVSQDTTANVLAYLSTLPGYMRRNDEEVTNLEAIYSSRYDVREKTIYTRYFGGSEWYHQYKGVDAEEAMNKAHGVLEDRAAEGSDLFIKLPDKTLINTAQVDHAWVEEDDGKYAVKYIIAGNTSTIEGLDSLANANRYMERFAATSDAMIYLSDDQLLKIPSVGNIWIADEDDHGGCRLKYVIGSSVCHTDMPTDKAYEILNQCRKEHGFLRMNDKELINVDRISLIYYNKGDNELRFVIGGEKYTCVMGQAEARIVLDYIEENHPNYVRHQTLGMLNSDKLGRVYFDEEKKELNYIIGTSNWHSENVSIDRARHVLNKLQNDEDYLCLSRSNHTYVNMNALDAMYFNSKDGRLEYTINGDKDRWTKMDRAKAIETIETIQEFGRKRALAALELEYEGVDLDAYTPPKAKAAPQPEPVEEPSAAEEVTPEEPEDNVPEALPFRRETKFGSSLVDIFDHSRKKAAEKPAPVPEEESQTAPKPKKPPKGRLSLEL